VDNLLLAVVALCWRWLQPRHNVQMQFLQAQIRVLRARVKSERILLSPEERAELLRLGSEMDHQVGELLHVVKPDTYRRWRQEQKRGRAARGVGRPPLAAEVQDLIVRFATENSQWGYRRIVGELKKLGHAVSASAARGVLVARDLPPAPKKSGRQLPMAWTRFVRANLDSLVATDFFTQPVHTLSGTVQAYVLVFVHLGTRKVLASAATLNPDAAWMQQQARNAVAWVEDEGLEVKWLIHDRDAKFSRKSSGASRGHPSVADTATDTEGERLLRILHRHAKARVPGLLLLPEPPAGGLHRQRVAQALPCGAATSKAGQ